MLAGLAVLPATVIIVPLLSVGSGALDDNSGGGGGSVGGDGGGRRGGRGQTASDENAHREADDQEPKPQA